MIYSYRTPERDAGVKATDYAMSRSAAAFCVWITSHLENGNEETAAKRDGFE